MTPLKQTVEKLTRRIEALASLRQRFAVDGMDNYERAKLAVELKAIGLRPDSIFYITDMREQTNEDSS